MEMHIREHTVIIDDGDWDRVSKHRWNVRYSRGVGVPYFYTYIDGIYTTLHRILMGCSRYDGRVIDHINRNTLDNTMGNLRDATAKDNSRNTSISRANTSGYKGVAWHKRDQAWTAGIKCDGIKYGLGEHEYAAQAAKAYDIAALHLFGEYAATNFPVSDYDGLDLAREFETLHKYHKSLYRGIYYRKNRHKWEAWIHIETHKKRYFCGRYSTPLEAAIARDAKAFELLGQKAKLNFPEHVVDGVYNKEIKHE